MIILLLVQGPLVRPLVLFNCLKIQPLLLTLFLIRLNVGVVTVIGPGRLKGRGSKRLLKVEP